MMCFVPRMEARREILLPVSCVGGGQSEVVSGGGLDVG
jgi:hypothetical protein